YLEFEARHGHYLARRNKRDLVGTEIAFCSTIFEPLRESVGDEMEACFWLAQERGHKTKTTKLIAGGIGSTWIQLEIVNPSTFPTHSARESKWAKVEAVLNAATRCSREIELIQEFEARHGHYLARRNKSCFWLARERCHKTKTTKLIAGGIGSTWVQLERVNPSPFPTHSAQESERAKA
ncbi:hypothetical protein H5410_065012, partial [Solanum commersonii]